jgi:glycosyltransferase involved in cell wall biosynthesis
MFSIIIPTFNNFKFLKLCLESIKKNSVYKHEIIPHVNIGDDGTKEYLIKEKIYFTFTNYNSGICKGMNLAAQKAKCNYILYAHDDFYFCPGWDVALSNEIKLIGHNNFYLSGVMINNGPIKYNCGDDVDSFDEEKLLMNYNKIKYFDFQGSTWAPHLIHRDLWNAVGGFSEEFYPGTGSDPDLNMKLWKKGIRIFKGINSCRVYHFGSIVTRKYKNHPTIKTESGNKGSKIFLLKWGISIKFFKKYYLNSDIEYTGPLKDPEFSFFYFFNLLKCKIYLNYLRILKKLNIN